jgi:hypothetical protein
MSQIVMLRGLAFLKYKTPYSLMLHALHCILYVSVPMKVNENGILTKPEYVK